VFGVNSFMVNSIKKKKNEEVELGAQQNSS